MIKYQKDNKIPALGYGTYPLVGEACTVAVKDAIEIGYKHIDTASIYKNEEAVGKAINDSKKRDELFVTTKVWYTDLSKNGIRKSMENSLTKLNFDHVDLLLIHWPTAEMDVRSVLEVFFELQEEGKTRHVGVSNFPAELFKQACEIGPIFTNQVEYHPYLAADDLIAICNNYDVLLTAYSPLAQGTIANEPVLQRIGEKYQRTPAQVTLKWLIQQPKVLAIPQSSSHSRRVENFQIFDFELSQDEMNAIHVLERGERLCKNEWSLF